MDVDKVKKSEPVLVDKDDFNKKLSELCKKRALNTLLLPQDKYRRLIDQIKLIKVRGKKGPGDYRIVNKYTLIELPNGKENIYHKPDLDKNLKRLIVPLEESYNIIHEYHLKLNHGGRSRMMVEIKKKYYNVTTESVNLYLSMCDACKNKVIKKNKSIKSGDQQSDTFHGFTEDDPLQTSTVADDDNETFTDSSNIRVHPELFSRGQVDLLCVTNETSEEFKYLMVYRDYPNKFTHLKAMKDISVDEIAESLLEIFLVFGAPNVLGSKNGISINKAVCRRISALCPDIKVVHASTSISLCSFEGKLNEDILRKLNDWLVKTQNTKWQNGVKYIQHSLNTTFNEVICRTPSELVFGTNPSKGLASIMTSVQHDDLSSEAEFEKALTMQVDSQETVRSKPLILSESLILPEHLIKLEVDSLSEEEKPLDEQ